MSAPEFLYLVRESAYGVPTASPVNGTDAFYIRLADGNSFTMTADPVIQEIMYGGGWAVTAEAVSDFTEVKGSLRTKLYPGQAQFLLDWALGRINAGQTSPWTTTEPPGDLASVSCYHAFQRADGTYKAQRYAGTKVASLRLEASRSDPVWKVALDLVAQKNVGNSFDASADPVIGTDFNAPADTDYPTGPYLYVHSSGGLTLGSGAGTVRTQYESLSLAVANALDAELRLKATPDDRSAYEALTSQAAKLIP